MNNILSIYGSHDAAASFVDKSGEIKILEYERYVKKRYAMFSDRFDDRPLGTDDESRRLFLQYIKENVSAEIDTLLYGELSDSDILLIKEYFPKAEAKKIGHHTAHAASGYYLSPFKDAYIISIDGGGAELDGIVNTKTFIGQNEEVSSIKQYKIDLGNAYSAIGHPISEIRAGLDDGKHSMVYAGKTMGICAYGNVRDEWMKPLVAYYKSGGANLEQLGRRIGMNLSKDSLSGQDSFDLARTSQAAFEQIFFDLFWDEILERDTDVILVGGCALNVLLNQRLSEELEKIGKRLYVPSNPNDCGLAVGQLLYETKHRPEKDLVYSGFELLDELELQQFVEKYDAKKADISDLVSLMRDGKIIGVADGCSEVGPRALGNRSIICDPSYENMKDILNAKVKFREWFRPFAPVCRFEDMDTYFNNACESIYMSYAPMVKDEYQNKIPAITHADGSARLQTTTRDQHEFFYDVITEMKEQGAIPVILNTSFNIKGYPILTTISDALYALDNTELDYVYSNGYLFSSIKNELK